MENCPHCGYALPRVLKNGIASCLHCNRIFDSCRKNVLLSACWNLRKDHVPIEVFQFRTGLNPHDAYLVFDWIIEEGYSHDEVIKLINELE